jgi:hypothetical protein
MQEPNAIAGQSHDANKGKKRTDQDNDGDEGEKINKKVTVCVADENEREDTVNLSIPCR